jgi:hypothetical protein
MALSWARNERREMALSRSFVVDLIEAEGADEGHGVARHRLDGRWRGPA